MKAYERDRLANERKLEAINAGLAQHERATRITMLLVVLLNATVVALLAYYLLVYD